MHARSVAFSGRIQGRNAHSRRYSTRTYSLFDEIRNFCDFESWAPKSSRRWRLRQPPSEAELAAAEAQEAKMMDSLRKREGEVRASSGGSVAAPAAEDEGTSDREQDWTSGRLPPPPVGASYDDTSLAESLQGRIASLASGSAAGSVDSELEPPLTPEELRQLIFVKYGKTHDLSIVRRDFPGKTFVMLNVMWVALEQRSFPYSEEEYMEKLGGICYMLDAWGETGKVRSFLKEPAKARKGLPARPVVGIAISIQLDLSAEVVAEWFGNRT